eukprot:3127283-Prymnesium_polylepis.1
MAISEIEPNGRTVASGAAVRPLRRACRVLAVSLRPCWARHFAVAPFLSATSWSDALLSDAFLSDRVWSRPAVVGIDPERARPDPERMKQLESQTAQAVAIQAAFRGKQVRCPCALGDEGGLGGRVVRRVRVWGGREHRAR